MSVFDDFIRKKHHSNRDSFHSFVQTLKEVCSNKIMLSGLVVIGIILLAIIVVILLFSFQALSYMQNVVSEKGLKGIADLAMETLQRLWLGGEKTKL